ncbi:MAG: peptidase, partial [Pseudomonadota bacterium]
MSDTRTNAGVDNISRVRKLFTWTNPGERAIAMMTAGNLATTQAVISEINEAIEANDPNVPSIYNARSMYEVAQIVGNTMRNVINRYGAGLSAMGEAGAATIIVGGERMGGVPRLFMVYSAGNFIEATEDSPYFQIGEHKY